MEKDYKADFISFLKKKRVWMLYKRLTMHKSYCPEITEWLDLTKPSNYISSAFIWKFAEKGREFWEKLNAEWYAMNEFADED